jgi:hypothetical protein
VKSVRDCLNLKFYKFIKIYFFSSLIFLCNFVSKNFVDCFLFVLSFFNTEIRLFDFVKHLFA